MQPVASNGCGQSSNFVSKYRCQNKCCLWMPWGRFLWPWHHRMAAIRFNKSLQNKNAVCCRIKCSQTGRLWSWENVTYVWWTYCKSESPALVTVLKARQASSCQRPHQNKHGNRYLTWLHVSAFPSSSDLSVLAFAATILLSLRWQTHPRRALINSSFWMYRRSIFGKLSYPSFVHLFWPFLAYAWEASLGCPSQ